jgi:predicted peptidase
MGGFGTWATIGEFPERFAAAVPICGRGDPEEAPRMKDLPIWAFHGAKDPAVPVRTSQRMVDALAKLGSTAKLTIYPDALHDSWTRTYADPALYAWLLQQRLGQPAQPPAP